MTDGQWLYIFANMSLDKEEEEANMCPDCLEDIKKHKCIICGKELQEADTDNSNPNFDADRFEKLKRGEQ